MPSTDRLVYKSYNKLTSQMHIRFDKINQVLIQMWNIEAYNGDAWRDSPRFAELPHINFVAYNYVYETQHGINCFADNTIAYHGTRRTPSHFAAYDGLLAKYILVPAISIVQIFEAYNGRAWRDSPGSAELNHANFEAYNCVFGNGLQFLQWVHTLRYIINRI